VLARVTGAVTGPGSRSRRLVDGTDPQQSAHMIVLPSDLCAPVRHVQEGGRKGARRSRFDLPRTAERHVHVYIHQHRYLGGASFL